MDVHREAAGLSRYFDHAATTPVDPEVLEAMLPFLGGECGNAHSLHGQGARARAAVDEARSDVANLLGCALDEVVFTSGATESNNWVLRAFDNVAVSPFEHSSVREPAELRRAPQLPNNGWSVGSDTGGADLVSVMTVNNETGAVVGFQRSTGHLVHRDVTQHLGKLPLDVTGIDFASFSAHKLYGPKGVGGLYIKDARPLSPLLVGGGQENGLRAGTLNVPGIVGFGRACRLAGARWESDLAHVAQLRQTVISSLSGLSDWRANEHTGQSPYILSLSYLGVQGETLVVELDALGYAVSAGAACSSGSNEPSHVLLALNVPEEWARGTVRVSFGRSNTVDAAEGLGKALATTVDKLRTLAK